MNREQKQFFTQCAPRYPEVMHALIEFRALMHEICKGVLESHLREFCDLSGLPRKSLELGDCGAPKQIPLKPPERFWAGMELKRKSGKKETFVWLYISYYREQLDQPFDIWAVYHVRPPDPAKRRKFNRSVDSIVNSKFRRRVWEYEKEYNAPCFELKVGAKDVSNLENRMTAVCRIAIKVLKAAHVSGFF